MNLENQRQVILVIAAWAAVAVVCAFIGGCPDARPAEKPAIYEMDLTACTEKSHTLTESIVCENEVRAKQSPPRPPRALPPRLSDGGVR
jgi:anti-sigma-K factor RskA